MIEVRRILVLAPHPDDEIIGCGVLLKECSDAGLPVRVVVVTDGAVALPSGADAAIRKAESRAGLARLGIHDCEFWDYPDGRLPFGGPIADRYLSLVSSYRPTDLVLPHPAESHPDHRSLTRGMLLALESRWVGKLWFYETNEPCQPLNVLKDATDALDDKLAALACHASQLASFDYLAHCRALARMRGLTLRTAAAEGFLAFEWDGSPQQFFVAEPMVSIVVRASSPELVAHALASLAQQSYPWIEIVLVWFGADPVPDTTDLGLPIVVVRGTHNRSANLNAGVSAAHGSLIGFLDEDDVFYAEHVAELVAELVAAPNIDVAFSGCRLVNCRREDDRILLIGEVRTFDDDYAPGHLLLENYITLNSALARSSVMRTISFDPELEAYEDWDFFAQVEQRGFRFSRVDALSCEYRLFPEPGEVADLETIHRRKGYLDWRKRVHERICRRFSPADLDRLEKYANRHAAPIKQVMKELANKSQDIASVQTKTDDNRDLVDWVHTCMTLDRTLPTAIDATVRTLIGRNLDGPVVSVILPVYNTAPQLLAILLQSIVDQSYPRWQLCIADDASTNAETLHVLDNFAAARTADGRVFMRRRSENGGIVAASNEALASATGELVAFVDHDDVLHPDALLRVAIAARQNPGVKLIYTDSRTIDHVGNVLNVFSKPDWSPTTLLSYNYVNHLTVVRRELLVRLGGLRQEFTGSQDWDLLLRMRAELRDQDVVHLPYNLYDWRATSTSVAYSSGNKPWALDAGRRALADAVAPHVGVPVAVEVNVHGIGYHVNWRGTDRPVTVVIPTHSNRDGLRICLKGLLEQTAYPELQLLVIANRCEDAQMRADLDALAGRTGVRVLDDASAFNWAALMNRAVQSVATEAVLFLNDDVEVLAPDWLQRMQRYLDLPGIGAVGAALYYPDGDLQHGGVETDGALVATAVKKSLAPQEMAGVRDVSAVTGACLLTTRSALSMVGGFDESFPVHYNDVDFCLALRQAGLRVIQAADVRLRHHESATRERPNIAVDAEFAGARKRMQMKWGDFLKERYRVTYLEGGITRMIDVPQ